MSLKNISLAFVSITASSVLVANEVFFNNNFDQNQTNLSGIYNDQYSQQNSLYNSYNSNHALNPAITGNDLNPTDSKGLKLFNTARTLVAGNGSADIETKVTQAIANEGVGVAKSFLEKYFPTVEISYTTGLYGKPTTGVLVVAPLSDRSDVKNTLFTQVSTFYTDNRTTVNLGLGYRRLEWDNKLLLGANLFYDHEFPYDHQRTSVGLEARTTVGEVNFNQYWGISGWQDGRGQFEERALGGTDLEVGVPLPYMNWVKFYARGFIWDRVDGVNDLKGHDLSLQATINGWSVSAGKRSFNGLTDNDFMQVSYNFMADKPTEKMEWFSSQAYQLASMEDRRYDKVRRENIIIKQTRSGNKIGFNVSGV
jgi:hypothetical protein